MLKKKVLVNGISNLSDARYCAGMMVDFLSFELNENHEDSIPVDKIKEIKDWLSGPQIGGRLTEWTEGIDWETLKPDFLIITDESLLGKAQEKAPVIFFETSQSSISGNFDALIYTGDDLETMTDKVLIPIFVDLMSQNSTLEELSENDKITGIGLRGQKESRPGFSQYDELMDALEALEEDF